MAKSTHWRIGWTSFIIGMMPLEMARHYGSNYVVGCIWSEVGGKTTDPS